MSFSLVAVPQKKSMEVPAGDCRARRKACGEREKVGTRQRVVK